MPGYELPSRSELLVYERGAVRACAGGNIVIKVEHDAHVFDFQAIHVHSDCQEMPGGWRTALADANHCIAREVSLRARDQR